MTNSFSISLSFKAPAPERLCQFCWLCAWIVSNCVTPCLVCTDVGELCNLNWFRLRKNWEGNMLAIRYFLKSYNNKLANSLFLALVKCFLLLTSELRWEFRKHGTGQYYVFLKCLWSSRHIFSLLVRSTVRELFSLNNIVAPWLVLGLFTGSEDFVADMIRKPLLEDVVTCSVARETTGTDTASKLFSLSWVWSLLFQSARRSSDQISFDLPDRQHHNKASSPKRSEHLSHIRGAWIMSLG